MAKDSNIYFKDGTIIAESGKARVYEYNDDIFLEIGDNHHLWALGSESIDYANQLKGRPKGSVLEIGLGLGVASKYILSMYNVRSLTTIEKNKDVIDVYNILKDRDEQFIEMFGHKKHLILNTDGLSYVYNTQRKFDFIFLDFYDIIDEDTLPEIADMVIGCRRVLAKGGEIAGWFDPYTPNEFVKQFYSLFEEWGD
jgi:spermidine synthase